MTLYLGTYPLGQSVLSLSFYVYLHFFLSFFSAPFRPHFASLCMFNLSSKQHSLSCQIFLSKSLINCLHLRNINLCFYLSPLKPFPITIYLFFYISLFSKHELSFKTILSIFVNIKHRYRNCWWLDSNPGHLASEATEPQPLSYSYSAKIIIMFFTSSTFLLYLCYLLSLHPTWQPDHPETTKSEREREREGGREKDRIWENNFVLN